MTQRKFETIILTSMLVAVATSIIGLLVDVSLRLIEALNIPPPPEPTPEEWLGLMTAGGVGFVALVYFINRQAKRVLRHG